MSRIPLHHSAIAIGMMVGASIYSSHGVAITQYSQNQSSYIRDPLKLKASLNLEVNDVVVPVNMPTKLLKYRVQQSPKDERVESVQIKIPVNLEELRVFSAKIAKISSEAKVFDLLGKKMTTSRKNEEQSSVRVTLSQDDLKFFAPAKVAELFSKPHHQITINGEALHRNSDVRKKLFEQIWPHFNEQEKRQISKKIRSGLDLELERDLLPSFARKMVRKFIAYRGPNCFHASLAFHGPNLSSSKLVNVKREDGYHKAMINYDELWRTLNNSFYEVDVERSELKYGDILVFLDTPPNAEVTSFRWIRHAAVYLIGSYTFSKGSKSPDTPYTVKTLAEEWDTWQKFSKNLGVKVFRRTQKHAKRKPPKDLTDWIY